MLIPFPTQRSIQTARAVMLAERAQATAQVGLHFHITHCPICLVELDGSGVNEKQAKAHAEKALDVHVLRSHAS